MDRSNSIATLSEFSRRFRLFLPRILCSPREVSFPQPDRKPQAVCGSAPSRANEIRLCTLPQGSTVRTQIPIAQGEKPVSVVATGERTDTARLQEEPFHIRDFDCARHDSPGTSQRSSLLIYGVVDFLHRSHHLLKLGRRAENHGNRFCIIGL